MNDQGPYKRRESYSVHGLWAAGSRFYLDEYTKEEAIQDYLELHPEANEIEVRAELEAEIKRRR